MHLPVGYGSCGVAASADCLRHHVSGQAGWSGVDPNRLHQAQTSLHPVFLIKIDAKRTCSRSLKHSKEPARPSSSATCFASRCPPASAC